MEAALEEMIAVGKALRTPVEISHLKSIGKENWHRSTPNMLRRMARARENGVPGGRTRRTQRELEKTLVPGADQKAHGDGKRL